MSSLIDKKELEHLAELARIKLRPEEEKQLLHDMQNILEHVKELNSVPTDGVEPMNGGTRLTNIFREDEERENTNRGAGHDGFPKEDGGFLSVPPVFE
jgi:aspartyl-tRNA(Asn)/glutamyl-tRNA(Gln) amidotransferase subunit C